MKQIETDIRTSVSISNEITDLEKSAASAASSLEELATQDDAMLLAGDDAADKHDQKKTFLKRTIRRAELRLADLRPMFVTTKEREDAAALAERQRKATAAVDAMAKRLKSEYLKHATSLAQLMRDLYAVEVEAHNAGVATIHSMTRVVPDRRIAAHEEEYTIYLDQNGNETPNQFNTLGVWNTDPSTGEQFQVQGGRRISPPENRAITKTRVVPEKLIIGHQTSWLTDLVKLPGIGMNDASVWPIEG